MRIPRRVSQFGIQSRGLGGSSRVFPPIGLGVYRIWGHSLMLDQVLLP